MISQDLINLVAAYPRLEEIGAEPYEPRGIFNSEMAAVIALTLAAQATVLIESGRARGHSTSLLAKHLGSRNIAIHSFDRDRRGDAIYAETKLAGLPNLHLHYGDSRIAVPRLIGELANQRVALLIDGPKDKKALDLLSNCIAMDSTVVIAFVHDLPGLVNGTPSEGRRYATEYFERPVFTDDEAFVARFRDLDTSVFADPDRSGWRPFQKEGESQTSYGPTLGIFFPTDADREAAKRRQGSAGRLLGSYYWAFKDWLRGIGSPAG